MQTSQKLRVVTNKSEDINSTVTIRSAVIRDAIAISNLINNYAEKGLMLTKSRYQVYQHLQGFIVAEVDGDIVGCGVLHIMWDDLAEIRSLAVEESYTGQGIGRSIVKRLIEQAQQLGIPQVFALTYVPGFFERLGFRHMPKRALPQKIWLDCINCAKFPDCDEEALLLRLEGGPIIA